MLQRARTCAHLDAQHAHQRLRGVLIGVLGIDDLRVRGGSVGRACIGARGRPARAPAPRAGCARPAGSRRSPCAPAPSLCSCSARTPWRVPRAGLSGAAAASAPVRCALHACALQRPLQHRPPGGGRLSTAGRCTARAPLPASPEGGGLPRARVSFGQRERGGAAKRGSRAELPQDLLGQVQSYMAPDDRQPPTRAAHTKRARARAPAARGPPAPGPRPPSVRAAVGAAAAAIAAAPSRLPPWT